jgi:hypothetical protein
VQAKTQAAKCTRSGWKGGGGDEALGVGARRTSLPVSAALLVCRGSETEQASGDGGGGGRAGDAGQPRLEAHVRWGWGDCVATSNACDGDRTREMGVGERR